MDYGGGRGMYYQFTHCHGWMILDFLDDWRTVRSPTWPTWVLQSQAKRKTNASLVVEEHHVEFFLAKFDGRLRGTHLCSEAEFWIGEVFSTWPIVIFFLYFHLLQETIQESNGFLLQAEERKQAAADALTHYSQFAMACIGQGVTPSHLRLHLLKVIDFHFL
jgi:hypothetical protein